MITNKLGFERLTGLPLCFDATPGLSGDVKLEWVCNMKCRPQLTGHALATVTGLASVTISLSINGVATNQSVVINAAATTTPKEDANIGPVLKPGDKLQVRFLETAAVDPGTKLFASLNLIPA